RRRIARRVGERLLDIGDEFGVARSTGLGATGGFRLGGRQRSLGDGGHRRHQFHHGGFLRRLRSGTGFRLCRAFRFGRALTRRRRGWLRGGGTVGRNGADGRRGIGGRSDG